MGSLDPDSNRKRKRGRPRNVGLNVFGTGLVPLEKRRRKRRGPLELENALAIQFEFLASASPEVTKEFLYRLLSELSRNPIVPRRSAESVKRMLLRLQKERRISARAVTSTHVGAGGDTLVHDGRTEAAELRIGRKRR